MTCKQKLHTGYISVPHSCCRCSLKLGHRLCQGQHSKGWYLKYHRKETTNFSNQHTLSIPLIFFTHLPVVLPFWASVRWPAQLGAGRRNSNNSLRLCFLLTLRAAAKACSQMWFSHLAAKQLVGFLDFGFSCTLCLLPHSAQKRASASQRYLAPFRVALTRWGSTWTRNCCGRVWT